MATLALGYGPVDWGLRLQAGVDKAGKTSVGLHGPECRDKRVSEEGLG